MKNCYIIKNSFLFILCLLGLWGCLKDEVSPVFEVSLSDNAMLLHYLEDHGDYINSINMPSIVSVDEVYNNINNCLIIDTRATLEYTTGHIPGAINIQNDSLITFLTSNEINQYAKVVLVSTDGQASSYYTCLLRLYGITNAFSLLFGMAQWNSTFANAWMQNIGNSPITKDFQFGTIINESVSKLPEVHFSNSNSTIESKVKERISEILKKGFINEETYVTIEPPDTMLFNGEPVNNFFIVCYGISTFCNQNSFDPLAVGHFPNAVSYVPRRNLMSTDNLQLLPDDKKIVVYSYSGQTSAFVVAYLRLLGYDAKSLLYGGNGLFYSYMVDKNDAYTPFVFFMSDVRNYPYVTGVSSK